MSILKLFNRNKSLLKSKKIPPNLLNSEGIKLFYHSKEAVHAYVIGEGILKRRKISLRIIEILDLFLKYEYSDSEINLINNIFENNFDILSKANLNSDNNDNTLINRLKSIDIKGYNLLGIKNDINITTLKSLYREASKKHHPDKDGSIKNMQKLNEVFPLFYEAITNYFPINELSTDEGYFISTPKNWNEWLFSIHLILACIYGDLFAADKSFYHLIKSDNYVKESKNKYIGQFIGNLLEEGGVLGNTCHALGRFNMKKELEQASQITSKFIDRFIMNWEQRYEGDEKPRRNNYRRKNDYLNSLGTRIVLKHIEQVKNAYRLHQIDKKRYLKTMKKFNNQYIDKGKIFNKINNFIDEVGFITKISNSTYKTKASNPKVVISPDSNIDRFDFLEEEQKWEYLNIFSKKNMGKYFDRYYYVRTNEILLGLITNYDNIELEKLEKEINFFSNNFQDNYSNYYLLDEIVHYLRKLDKDERDNKLQKLSEMDDPKIKTNSMSINITIDLNNLFSNDDVIYNKSKNNYKKRIQLDDDYIEFIKMNLKNIFEYKKLEKQKRSFIKKQRKIYHYYIN